MKTGHDSGILFQIIQVQMQMKVMDARAMLLVMRHRFIQKGVFIDNIMTGGGWSLMSENLDEEQGDTSDYCCPLYSSSSQGVQGYAGDGTKPSYFKKLR